MIEIIETLSWCAIRSVDANLDHGGLVRSAKFPQVARPIAIGFDVKLQLIADAGGDGEWMPLPETQRGYL